MKVCIFGGTGATGSKVIEAAMGKGYDVVALARRPEVLASRFPDIRVVPGDVFKLETISAAIADVDAAISTLGPPARTLRSNLSPAARKTTIYSEGVINIAKAMQGIGKRRLIVAASLIGIDPKPDVTWPTLFFAKLVLMPILGYQYRDTAKMKEELARFQDLDWTLVGLARLTNGEAKGRYRSSIGKPLDHPSSISHADLADYLVSIISETSTYRQWTEVSW
jgi:putative NADH-flavin reductase